MTALSANAVAPVPPDATTNVADNPAAVPEVSAALSGISPDANP